MTTARRVQNCTYHKRHNIASNKHISAIQGNQVGPSCHKQRMVTKLHNYSTQQVLSVRAITTHCFHHMALAGPHTQHGHILCCCSTLEHSHNRSSAGKHGSSHMAHVQELGSSIASHPVGALLEHTSHCNTSPLKRREHSSTGQPPPLACSSPLEGQSLAT